MKRILNQRPWLFIVFAFVLLMSAWTSLIVVAVKNRPATIEIHQLNR